ncbi:glycosyltransferase family protein [Aspergillus undulatus]|uniref:glycosyltransferase family protein n=1 Tax=Aspergillus undulatus TaxID=1810928 RepID=UPI003CCE2BF4
MASLKLALGLCALSLYFANIFLIFVALSQISYPGIAALFLFFSVVSTVLAVLSLSALAISQNTPVPKWRPRHTPIHLLVVLGSGGHTAEMLSMLRRMQLDPTRYTYRTYIVSSGDNFSVTKAIEFEAALLDRGAEPASYAIVTVPRARHVHQSYLTAPYTTILSFWSCLLALCGLHPDQQQQKPQAQLPSPYPDIILTNGPATAVCVILAAKLLRLSHWCMVNSFPIRMRIKASRAGQFRLRTVFVESWARVKTLSLSGKILLPFADRFLVQWPALEGKRAWWGMRKTEYVGGLLD